MKVLNLQCAQGHGFEGWFASEEDFRRQTESAFLTCPLCGESSITRLLSAPRLNLRGGGRDGGAADRTPGADTPSGEPGRPVGESASEAAAPVTAVPLAVQAAWLHAVRQVLAHTEDVGERFAEEARRIHHGEAPERGIRGKASPTETQALLDEGIAVMPLPIPDGMDGPVH